MARATLAEVRALLAPQGITIDDSDLTALLTTASTLVDTELLAFGLAEALLTEIEKYLSAHFTVLRELPAGISRESADDAAVTYTVGQASFTEDLKATHFGQVAIALDTTGTLRNAGGPQPQLIAL